MSSISATVSRYQSKIFNSSSTTFQFLFDLHLEVGQQYASFKIQPSAPLLVLAGDIGRLIDYEAYLLFLAAQTAQFEHIFLVLGNHEFNGLSISEGIEQAQRLEIEAILCGKLTLLNQTRFDVPNSEVIVMGCTLWSRIPDNVRKVVQAHVKDFQKIKDWTIDDHNSLHESDLNWLSDQVALVRRENMVTAKRERERKVLVVTHHAPCLEGTSRPEQVGNLWNSAFATDLICNSKDWEGVKVWVFGHTHFTTEIRKQGIRIVSNQRGYVLPGSEGVKRSVNDKKVEERPFDIKRVVRI